MAKYSVEHRQFTIERKMPARRERVFGAWANKSTKQQWFACDENMQRTEFSLDFKPGGFEIHRIIDPGGSEHYFHGYYLDIIDNERIIYAYNMFVDEQKLSSSIATLEFQDHDGETMMVYTEQIAFLDGLQDPEERIMGTGAGFNMLENFLKSNN